MREYVLGFQQGYNDLCEFWVHALTDEDKLEILTVTESDIQTQAALNGLTLPIPSREDVVMVIKHFVDYVSSGRTGVPLSGVDVDPVAVLTIVQVIERTLIEFRSMRTVWRQFVVAAIILAWRLATTASSFIAILLGILYLTYSISSPLVHLRRLVYANILTCFNTRLIAPTDSVLILIGPVVLGILVRGSELSWCWNCAAFPALATAMSSNVVSEPGALRLVYMLHRTSTFLFNSILLYISIRSESYMIASGTLIMFNSGLVADVAGFGILGSLIVGAFMKDLVTGLRDRVVAKVALAISLVVYSNYCWSGQGQFGVSWLLLAVITLCVFLPVTPVWWSDCIRWIFGFGEHVYTQIVNMIDTLQATLIIFQESPGNGCTWLHHLLHPVKVKQ